MQLFPVWRTFAAFRKNERRYCANPLAWMKQKFNLDKVKITIFIRL